MTESESEESDQATLNLGDQITHIHEAPKPQESAVRGVAKSGLLRTLLPAAAGVGVTMAGMPWLAPLVSGSTDKVIERVEGQGMKYGLSFGEEDEYKKWLTPEGSNNE